MGKSQKIGLVIKTFLEHPNYPMTKLAELSELKALKISRTTISKYLSDPLIIDLYGKGLYDEIQKLLKQNKLDARKNINNKKDRTNETLKLERKIRHLLAFNHMFLNYSSLSFHEIAKIYNRINVHGETVDGMYVYACLISKIDCELLVTNLWNQVSDKLCDNKNINIENYKDDQSLNQERKIGHLLAFAHILLNYSPMSFYEIAKLYNETNIYNEKVDGMYVYICLTSKSNYDLLKNNLWNQVSKGIDKKTNQENNNLSSEIRKK